jgi:hypothetical protein
MTISNEGAEVKNSALQMAGMPSAPTKPEKLHGRAFYESLGSPKFVLAPMVDQSEFVLTLSQPHPTHLIFTDDKCRHGACSHALL